MVTGTVHSSKGAVVRLTVLGSQERQEEVEFLVDTGFTGACTLPPDLVVSLDLSFHGRSVGTLADGSERLFYVFEAEVLWDGLRRRAAVYASEAGATPLLGLSLLYSHKLTIDVVEEGNVSIRPLPPS